MERREYTIPKYFTTPVYFRKGYELRNTKIKDAPYKPLELENTTYYTFDYIL